MNKIVISRREFVGIATQQLAIFAVGFWGFQRNLKADSSRNQNSKQEISFAPNAWLTFLPSGEIQFILDRIEMGQGIMTGLTMIIAEELHVSIDRIRIVPAPADRRYVDHLTGVQITGGSTSMKHSYTRLRQAAACARMMFCAAAAKLWQIDVKNCESKNGFVVARKAGKDRKNIGKREPLAFKDLLEIIQKISPPEKIPLKKSTDWKIIGTSPQRVDNFAKVTGQALFGIDIRNENMLHAYLITAPRLNQKLKSFDAAAALKLPGVQKVFATSRGVAVVANFFWQAMRAAQQVKVEWQQNEDQGNISQLETRQIFKNMRALNQKQSGKIAFSRGNIDSDDELKSQKLERRYFLPYLAHATMEPCNFSADVGDDHCHLWGSTQSIGMAQQVAAELTGLSHDQIKVFPQFVGGGFGRRLAQDYVADTVEIAMQLEVPVKLIYDRDQDTRLDCFRPVSDHHFSALIDKNQTVQSWQHQIVAPSIIRQVGGTYLRTMAPTWVPEFLKTAAGATVESLSTSFNMDKTTVEGAIDLAYNIPHQAVRYQFFDPGIAIGFWRSVGHSYTAFAVESFVDEVAAKVQVDPWKWRLRSLPKKSPLVALLKKVASMASWSKSVRGPGIGLGIAAHSSFSSHVAQIVEVMVPDGDLQSLRVTRVWVAIDCGQCVYPDMVRAQMESSVVFGLSAALWGQISVRDGVIQQTNFDQYRLVRMEHMPKVEVAIIKSKRAPTGVGEPGVPPLAPALCNAIFAACGKRIRRLPVMQNLNIHSAASSESVDYAISKLI